MSSAAAPVVFADANVFYRAPQLTTQANRLQTVACGNAGMIVRIRLLSS